MVGHSLDTDGDGHVDAEELWAGSYTGAAREGFTGSLDLDGDGVVDTAEWQRGQKEVCSWDGEVRVGHTTGNQASLVWGDDSSDNLVLDSASLLSLINRKAPQEELFCHLEKVNSGNIIDTVMDILKEIVEVTITPDEYGALPLHYAAKAGMVELVELLLERYPNSAQETDNEGWLPLHYACSSPDVATISVLIDAHPDGVMAPTIAGELPLHFACDAAHRQTAAVSPAPHAVSKMLLEAFPEGAYQRSSFGQRPLLYVFGHDMLPADYSARTTEDFPADENSAEENSAETPVQIRALFQRQPLMPKVCGYWERWACVEGIMQMLAMFSDDRDDLHKVPLHYACKEHEGVLALAIVKALIKVYPEAIREVDELGNLPLHYVCLWREPFQSMAVSRMLDVYPHGAAVSNRLGLLPVHLVCRNGGASSVLAVSSLLDAYPEGLRQTDRQGMSAIHHACDNLGKGAVLPILEELASQLSDEDLMQADREGLTPLHHAVANEGVQCGKLCEYLLGRSPRAVLAKDRNLRLPLHVACRNQTTFVPDMVSALLKVHPESVEAVDRHGALPIHSAALNEGPAALNLLLVLLKEWSSIDCRGCKSKDRGGMLPLHHACRNESELGDNLVEVLLHQYPAAAAIPDRNGMLPMHHVCGNECQGRFSADVATDTFDHLVAEFRGATYHEDRDGRLPLHHACMNKGPVANYLVHALANIDSDGANKRDRQGKLALDYARDNKGLAASKPMWTSLEVTQLIKYREYIEGDETGEVLGNDRDVYTDREGNQILNAGQDRFGNSIKNNMAAQGHTDIYGHEGGHKN